MNPITLLLFLFIVVANVSFALEINNESMTADVLQATTTLDACHKNSDSTCTHSKNTTTANHSAYIVTRTSCWTKTEPTYIVKAHSDYTILKPTSTIVTTCKTTHITKTRHHSTRPTTTIHGGKQATITGSQTSSTSTAIVPVATNTVVPGGNSISGSGNTDTLNDQNSDNNNNDHDTDNDEDSTTDDDNDDNDNNDDGNENNDDDDGDDDNGDDNGDDESDENSNGEDNEDSSEHADGTSNEDPNTTATATSNAGITQSTDRDNIFETNNANNGRDGNNDIFTNPELVAQNDNSHKALGIGLGVSIGCVAALGLAGLLVYNRRKRNSGLDEDVAAHEVPTRWRPQSFMGVVSSVIAKLPRSPSQRSKASTDLLGGTMSEIGPGADSHHHSTPAAVISHGGDAGSSRQY